MKKILIGICSGGTIHAQTAASLVGALDQLKRYGDVSYKLSIQIGGDKPRALNRLVKEMMEGGFDYFMSIDNDMVFPPDGIIRLLENDKDIVGGNYAVRGNGVDGDPKQVVVKVAGEDGKNMATTLDKLPKELFRCRGTGNGFVLYKRKVFTQMPKPYFRVDEMKNGDWHGEDILFHTEAQDNHGLEVWCNPKIKIGHIGFYQY